MDEAAPVALSEHMQDAGLIQVDQFNKVLHFVQRGGVGLYGVGVVKRCGHREIE